jgi:hypothetical protein
VASKRLTFNRLVPEEVARSKGFPVRHGERLRGPTRLEGVRVHEVPLLNKVPAGELLRHLGKRVNTDAIRVRNGDRTHGETRHGLVSGEPELAHAVVKPPLAPVPPLVFKGLEGIPVRRPAASLEANRAKQGWLLVGSQRRLRERLVENGEGRRG